MEAVSAARIDEHAAAKEREIKSMWCKFIVSAAFSVPLLYIAMGHMIGWPLPKVLHPMERPLFFALVQVALVIPSIIAGGKTILCGGREGAVASRA
jgi:Cu+-exporting ATPase